MPSEPAAAPTKIFISCVSSEFGSYRRRLAQSLRGQTAQRIEVLAQEEFRQGGGLLLEAIGGYIADADVVVHLVGRRCGYIPTPQHVRDAIARLNLTLPDPLPERSATQWEYHMAREISKRLLVYIVADDANRDDNESVETADQTALQQAHLDSMHVTGQYTKPVASLHDFVPQVFNDLGLNPALARPTNLPFGSIGELFKGRDEFLEQIKSTLGVIRDSGSHRAAAITATAAVHGLGGIGKTRAAIEYALANRTDFSALLFVKADSPENLESSLASLCGPMVLNLPEHEAREAEAQVAAALRWLQNNPGWFLIFDNVDDEDAAKAVEALLGRLAGHGQVLITSRLSNWPDAVHQLDLDVLTVEASADYLLSSTASKRRKTQEDSAAAAKLAELLGQLPLALTQAAAYIGEQGISFAKYIEIWEKSLEKVMRWFNPRLMQYPASVAITWETSFAKLDEPAKQLLRILAFMAPNPIPESLLDVEVEESSMGELTDPNSRREALLQLRKYSLVDRDLDRETFSVHRLVQQATQANMPDDARRIALERGLAWLNAAMQGNPQDVRTWPSLEPLAPHTDATCTAAEKAGVTDGAPRLLNMCATLHQGRARFTAAEPLFRRAIAIGEASLGAEHPDVATWYNNLAALLNQTARYGEAMPLFERALTIRSAFTRDNGHLHPDLHTSMRWYLINSRELGKSATETTHEIEQIVDGCGVDLDAVLEGW